MRIISFLSGKLTGVEINADQKIQIAQSIALTNWKRIRILLLVSLCFDIIFIIFFDFPDLSNKIPERLWLPQSYLALHAFIGLIAVIGIILSSRLLNRPAPAPNDLLTPVCTLFMLIPISVISGLDQVTTSLITIFIVSLLAYGTLIFIKTPINYLVYTLPYVFFVAGLFIFQNDQFIRISHLLNGTILFLVVLILSRFIYDNRVSHLIKNIKLEEANQKLSFLSSHDPLTGLSNRRNFEMHIKRELSLIKRYHQTSCLVLMNLDYFKKINDRYGHIFGDRVLQSVAITVENNLRDVDLAARWGDEDFLLLISQTSLDGAFYVANRIRKSLNEQTIHIENQEIHLSASFGIVAIDIEGNEEDPFLFAYLQAEKALYQAQQKGRNQVVVLSEFEESPPLY